MCVAECCVGDFDWFGQCEFTSLIYRLNLGVERFSEAVLIHLGFENALASMVILWKH